MIPVEPHPPAARTIGELRPVLEVFERHEPVLLVVNEAIDGCWQLVGGADAHSSSGKIGHLYHAVDNDPTLLDILDLSPGHSASHADIGEPSTRHPADVA